MLLSKRHEELTQLSEKTNNLTEKWVEKTKKHLWKKTVFQTGYANDQRKHENVFKSLIIREMQVVHHETPTHTCQNGDYQKAKR